MGATPEKSDDLEWLTYWIIFAIFHVAAERVDIVMQIIPGWELLELFAVAWLWCPLTQGAALIFEKVLKPFVAKHEKAIDEQLGKVPIINMANASFAIVVPLAFLLLPSIFTRLGTIVAGVAYPCYASFKSIMANDEAAIMQWLTYFFVYGGF